MCINIQKNVFFYFINNKDPESVVYIYKMWKTCLICSDYIPRSSVICGRCSKKISSGRFESFMIRCPVCFHPLCSSLYECSWCRRYPDFPVYGIYDYTCSPVRHCLESFKFRGNRKFSYFFAEVLYNSLKDMEWKDSVLVPVPCSPSALKRRGWDHMNLVAEILSRKYGCTVKRLIKSRKGFSAQQKSLGAEERAVFASSRFVPADEEVDRNCRIVLIDDVTTTGNTLQSCRRLLMDNGYKNICGLTIFKEL